MNTTIVAMHKEALHTFGYAHGADEPDDGVVYGYDFSEGVFSMNVWVGDHLVRKA